MKAYEKHSDIATMRLTLRQRDAGYVCYRLRECGFRMSDLSKSLSVSKQAVQQVVCGIGRSRRIEAEIARVLGKASWNEVVAEARLAVSGNYTPSAKDVAQFLAQTYQQYQNRLAEIAEHKKQMAEKLKPMRAAIAVKKWKR